MLWCKWLPFLAPFLGCQKEVAIAPAAVDSCQKLLDLFDTTPEPLVTSTSTVTLSNCIPATPVVPIHPATPMYHPAAARPTVSYFDFDYESEYDTRVPGLFFNWHDVIVTCSEWTVAIAHAHQDGGFTIPETRVSFFQIELALFAIFALHMFCMIVFRDYMLPYKVALELLRGFLAGSYVIWTLIGTCLLYTTYDTLQVNPITVGMSEFLAVTVNNQDVIKRFFRGKIFSWEHFWYYNPMPRNPDGFWVAEELGLTGSTRHHGIFWPAVSQWEHIRYSQRKGTFKPTTFAELSLGFSVWVYLRIVGFADGHDRILSEARRTMGPWIMRQYDALPRRVGILIEFIGIHLQNHGFDWYSPLRFLFKTLPLGCWHFLISAYAYFRLWQWSRVEARCGKPFESNLDGGGISMKLRAVLQELGTMSLDDMANLIMAHEDLKFAVHLQEPRIRQRVEKEHAAVMTELANRTKSWRASHRELLSDYNHCRITLDNVLRNNLCSIMDLDADAAENQTWFSSSFVHMSEEALPNGLHYRQPKGGFHKVDAERRSFNNHNFRRLMHNARKGVCGIQNRTMYMPRRIDVYNEKTWPIDLRLLGLKFGTVQREANPFDLDNRCPRPYVAKEIEDYVAAGQLQQWFEDMPERLRFKRGTMTDFFQQQGSRLAYKNGRWQRS